VWCILNEIFLYTSCSGHEISRLRMKTLGQQVVDCPPDDLSRLYDGSYQSSSQLDPSNPATFELVEHLITELVEIFPDRYIHFGGDEVQVPCYNSSDRIRAFMDKNGWSTKCDSASSTAGATKERKAPKTAGAVEHSPSSSAPYLGSTLGTHCPGYKHLIAYFLRRVQGLARKHGRIPAGWQEIFDHYGGNSPDTPTPPFKGIDPDTVRSKCVASRATSYIM
jgi:N-acetyl-beta-hexosaminidase